MAENSPKLSDLFEEIWKTYEYLEKCDEPLSSDSAQNQVRSALTTGETVIKMINDLQLFSSNEEIEEVSTNEIRYMLLSALMGYFTMKNTHQTRVAATVKGKAYFTDFLRQCNSYGVTDYSAEEEDYGEQAEYPRSTASGARGLMQMSSERSSKIRRYNKQKEQENNLNELCKQVEKEHVDDEVKRNYYLTLLDIWVNKSIEELDSITFEMQILEHKAKLGDIPEDKYKQIKKTPPLRPFIITKDILQKHVLGAGYPSLPTITIEEFCEQKLNEGTIQMSGMSLQERAADPEADKNEKEKEETMKEEKIEKDDPEKLARARNWDNWKDDHRRGWGNRQNMG